MNVWKKGDRRVMWGWAGLWKQEAFSDNEDPSSRTSALGPACFWESSGPMAGEGKKIRLI